MKVPTSSPLAEAIRLLHGGLAYPDIKPRLWTLPVGLQRRTEKTKEFLQRINWFRAAKLVAGSAISMSFGMPPIGLVGEIYGIEEKLIAGDVGHPITIDIAENRLKHEAEGGTGIVGFDPKFRNGVHVDPARVLWAIIRCANHQQNVFLISSGVRHVSR